MQHREGTALWPGSQPQGGQIAAQLCQGSHLFVVEAHEPRPQAGKIQAAAHGLGGDQLLNHLPVAEATAANSHGHGLMQIIEFAFEPVDIRGDGFPCRCQRAGIGALGQGVELLPQLLEDDAAIPAWIGNQGQLCAEAYGVEAVANHLQCGLLLAHHQNPFAATNGVSHHIHDGLAFARSWRALNQHSWGLACLRHRAFLGWVGLADQD